MFSESDDEKNSSNPNIEWKKKGLDNKEKLSRRIDTKKAEEHEAKSKNPSQNVNRSQTPRALPKGLKKIRKKISQSVYDEEDEDELNGFQIFLDPASLEMENNSLFHALNDNEKKVLEQKNTLKTIGSQQNAGKLDAINRAQKINQQAGVGRMDRQAINKDMLDPTFDETKVGKAAAKAASKKLKVKVDGMSTDKYKDVIKGVKTIRDLGGRVEGMKADKVAEAGEKSKDKKKVAEIIYDNAKSKDKVKLEEKAKIIEAKKLYEKTGRNTSQNLSKKQVREQTVRNIENENMRGNMRVKERPQRERN
ncbi:MAG: hypothetical protein PHE89_01950 [Alphaproteobacteria bacterium]|nr:hypothetical protein [Alphaproteobacteria bacterium]